MYILTDKINIKEIIFEQMRETNFYLSMKVAYNKYPNEFDKLYKLYINISVDNEIDILNDELVYINDIIIDILQATNKDGRSYIIDNLIYERCKYGINNNMISPMMEIISEMNDKLPNKNAKIRYFMDIALNVFANRSL
jgi:hypothetical protein